MGMWWREGVERQRQGDFSFLDGLQDQAGRVGPVLPGKIGSCVLESIKHRRNQIPPALALPSHQLWLPPTRKFNRQNASPAELGLGLHGQEAGWGWALTWLGSLCLPPWRAEAYWAEQTSVCAMGLPASFKRAQDSPLPHLWARSPSCGALRRSVGSRESSISGPWSADCSPDRGSAITLSLLLWLNQVGWFISHLSFPFPLPVRSALLHTPEWKQIMRSDQRWRSQKAHPSCCCGAERSADVGRPSLRVGWHQTPASEGGRWDVKAFGAFSEGTGRSQAKSSNEAVGGSWQEMLDLTLKQSQLPGLHTIQASLCPRVPCGPRAAPAGPDPPPHTFAALPLGPHWGNRRNPARPAILSLGSLPGCITPGRN